MKNEQVNAQIQTITNELTTIKGEVSELLSFTNEFTVKILFESYRDNTTLKTSVDNIQTAIQVLDFDHHIDVDLIKDVLTIILGGLNDLEEKFERLVELFEGWMDEITKEDLYDLLIPQFALELQNINMALEFPRNWIVPGNSRYRSIKPWKLY